jgi:hypothetical protein
MGATHAQTAMIIMTLITAQNDVSMQYRHNPMGSSGLGDSTSLGGGGGSARRDGDTGERGGEGGGGGGDGSV